MILDLASWAREHLVLSVAFAVVVILVSLWARAQIESSLVRRGIAAAVALVIALAATALTAELYDAANPKTPDPVGPDVGPGPIDVAISDPSVPLKVEASYGILSFGCCIATSGVEPSNTPQISASVDTDANRKVTVLLAFGDGFKIEPGYDKYVVDGGIHIIRVRNSRIRDHDPDTVLDDLDGFYRTFAEATLRTDESGHAEFAVGGVTRGRMTNTSGPYSRSELPPMGMLGTKAGEPLEFDRPSISIPMYDPADLSVTATVNQLRPDQEVTYSSPPLDRSDELQWTDTGLAVEYVVRDDSADRVNGKEVFWAAALAAIALTALVEALRSGYGLLVSSTSRKDDARPKTRPDRKSSGRDRAASGPTARKPERAKQSPTRHAPSPSRSSDLVGLAKFDLVVDFDKWIRSRPLGESSSDGSD